MSGRSEESAEGLGGLDAARGLDDADAGARVLKVQKVLMVCMGNIRPAL